MRMCVGLAHETPCGLCDLPLAFVCHVREWLEQRARTHQVTCAVRLHGQVVYPTVAEAVKDMHRVYATTVRVREVGKRVSRAACTHNLIQDICAHVRKYARRGARDSVTMTLRCLHVMP